MHTFDIQALADFRLPVRVQSNSDGEVTLWEVVDADGRTPYFLSIYPKWWAEFLADCINKAGEKSKTVN